MKGKKCLSEQLDGNATLPYEVHQYNLIDKRYISFIAPPATRFQFADNVPVENENGWWRYKAQWINDWVWVSVEIGENGSKRMLEHFTCNVQLLKRVRLMRVKSEEDWEKIYQVARKVVGV